MGAKLAAKFGTVLVSVDQPASIGALPLTVGFDQDLAAEAIRTSNRIRGLLTQFHPSVDILNSLR